MITDIQDLYQNLVATQLRLNLLRTAFGSDICEVVLSYLPSFHIVANNSNKSAETETKDRITQLNDNKDMIAQVNGFDENWTRLCRSDDKSDNENKKMNICVTPAKNDNKNRRNPLLANANISGNDTDHSNHSNMSLTPN